VIAVDTNVLVRFYVDDPRDPEGAAQRPAARETLEHSDGVFVPLTVVLELEWVTRGFYGFVPEDFGRVVEHLVGLPNVTVEDWPSILDALDLHRRGLDFADALHLVRSVRCERFVTFDDRRFARRAAALGVSPSVVVPGSAR
jgi:predicted nucleic-acid-binding protein